MTIPFEPVGLIGAGAMGSALGFRLRNVGRDLVVYDRHPEKVDALVSLGARGATSAAAVAMQCRVIILSLNSVAGIKEVVFGKSGIVESACPNTLIVDMSSIDPKATALMATSAREQGLRWVDSPLSGGVVKARSGDLTLMAGGEPHDVADAYEVLRDLSANFTHMGPAGAGQTTKLINQVLCGLNFLAVAEATQLAIDAGVDVEKLPKALKGGRADSVVLQDYMLRYFRKDYERTGRIDNMVKDLSAVQDLARHSNTSMPLTSLCLEIHRMLTASGLGGEDQAALMEFFRGPDKSRFR